MLCNLVTVCPAASGRDQMLIVVDVEAHAFDRRVFPHVCFSAIAGESLWDKEVRVVLVLELWAS
jgi:hypothetical protein